MLNLLRNSMIDLVQKTLAKGGTDVFSGKVDMQGYQNVLFVGIVSSVNSTGKIKLRAYGATSTTATSTSDGFKVIGSALTSSKGQADGLLKLDVVQPRQRYVASKVDRLSAAAEYAGTVAIRYGSARMESTTKASTDDLQTALLIQPHTTGSTST